MPQPSRRADQIPASPIRRLTPFARSAKAAPCLGFSALVSTSHRIVPLSAHCMRVPTQLTWYVFHSPIGRSFVLGGGACAP